MMVAVLVAGLLAGCGRGGGGRADVMSIPELGVSMAAPSGWRVDRDAPGMCVKGDYMGLLASEPLAGKPFAEAADAMSAEFGATVVARRQTKVGDRDAIEAVIDDPGGMRVLRLYVDFGPELAYVSYAVLKDEFPDHEAAFRASLASLRVGGGRE